MWGRVQWLLRGLFSAHVSPPSGSIAVVFMACQWVLGPLLCILTQALCSLTGKWQRGPWPVTGWAPLASRLCFETKL